MKQGIRILVFDAYGTLFDLSSIISICEEFFPGQGSVLSQLWRAKQIEYTWLYSLMGRYQDFWHVTESALVFACKTLKLACESDTRARLTESFLTVKPYPEVREALNGLSGYSLAILSNATPSMLQGAVQQAGLEGSFSHIISAEEVKTYKPNPRVYELALRKLGVEKAAVVFVSSNSWDVIGAKAFDFWTCWVNRSAASGEELGLAPDVTLSTLAELVDLL